jgi:hypothetical protein
MKKNRKTLLAIMLIVALGNYFRIVGNENVRLVQFLSIFVIGVLSALLVKELLSKFNDK